MAFLETLLVLHLFLPLTYCVGYYQLEVFVYNYEFPQRSCDLELMFENISIVTDSTSSNISRGLDEPLDGTCWEFFQIGFDQNLGRTNPITVNYTSEDDLYSFAEIMFANNSGLEAYNITIDLMTLPLNEDYSPRQRYMDESGIFALYLSLKRSCLWSFTGENCSTQVMEEQFEGMSIPSDKLTPFTSTAELILPTSVEELTPPFSTEELLSLIPELDTPMSVDELTLFSPTAVYLFASLGALIGFLIIIIIVLAIVICCISKRSALKEDFNSKRQDEYFVNPNAAMSKGTDSLESQAQTHLTLINGQVHFAEKERHKREVIKIADIANSNDEGTRQAKAKSNIYEEHKPEILNRNDDETNDVQKSPKVNNHNIEETVDSVSEKENKMSAPSSSIASAEGAISTSAADGLGESRETIETERSKRKSRLAQTESILYEENVGNLDKSEVPQASPIIVSSSDISDDALGHSHRDSSEPLIQKSPSPTQDKKNSLQVFVVSSSAPPDGIQEEKQHSSPTKFKVRKEKRLSSLSMEEASLVVANIGAEPEDKHTTDDKPFPDVHKDPEKAEHEASTTKILSENDSSKFKKPSGVKSLVRRMESQCGEAESPKTIEDFNLPRTSMASPTGRTNSPSPNLYRPCPSDVTKVKPKDSPQSQDVSSKKGPTISKHLPVDGDTIEIFEGKSKSMESICHKDECSKRVSIPYVSEKDHKKENVSKDIFKKRISGFEGNTSQFVATPAGPFDVISAQVPKIIIKETGLSPGDKSGAHATKVSKTKSSDLRGELQKKLKESATPKVTPNEQIKLSSQDKPKSPKSEKVTNFTKFWQSQFPKENSSTSKWEKPDAKDAAVFSTPAPTETGTKQAKKPLMPPKKIKVERASSSELEKVCTPVEIKPKKKLDESIVIAADGYVDIAGRRVGPVDFEDSAGYRYVPVDIPRRHGEAAKIKMMPNSAYGIPNVATGDSVNSIAAAAAQSHSRDGRIDLMPNLAYGTQNVSSAEGSNSVADDEDGDDGDQYEYEYVQSLMQKLQRR